ncbi:hypothetical protein HY041_02060 [Candidatus Roizmanbacteria bacterium]|nr:hypothetical protein [Candidatus Roizmanbacteria bacterium]
MPDESLDASQKAMAFEGLVRKLGAYHTREDEVEYLTKALHLQLPSELSIKRRKIILAETVKGMENAEGTRKLCDLFQHFPQRERE